MKSPLYAAIELGGTKTLCMVASGPDDVVDELRVPTTTPDETLGEVARFIKSLGKVKGIGIGAFGPVDVDPTSPHYGTIEQTPKIAWRETSLIDFFHGEFGCPVRVDTDVNAAGLGEYHYGAARGLHNFIYVTVGTGLGAGALIDGAPVYGLSHPEMGHLAMQRPAGDEDFTCICPFHDHCVEGLASGLALSKRWGATLSELPADHPAWTFEADYLAQFCHALALFYSPQRIIIGGGVSREALLERVRDKLHAKLNGYVRTLEQRSTLDQYICTPALEGRAGVIGALLLALPQSGQQPVALSA